MDEGAYHLSFQFDIFGLDFSLLWKEGRETITDFTKCITCIRFKHQNNFCLASMGFCYLHCNQ